MTRCATASVLDVLSGRIPEHLANPTVLEHPKLAVVTVQARPPEHG